MKVTSRAQYLKLHELHRDGKITHDKLKEATEGVDYLGLPERAEKEDKKPKSAKLVETGRSAGKSHKAHKSHKSWD